MLLRYPFSVVLFQFLFEGANLATNPKEQKSRGKSLTPMRIFIVIFLSKSMKHQRLLEAGRVYKNSNLSIITCLN